LMWAVGRGITVLAPTGTSRPAQVRR